jgi:hypothetical protein
VPAAPPRVAPSRQPEGGVFSGLRARRVHIPRLSPEAECPFSGAITLDGIPAEAALGPGVGVEKLDDGPLYVVLPGIPTTLYLLPPTDDGRRMATILLVSRPSYRGPILTRGRRLDGPHAIRFLLGGREEPEVRLPSGPWDERTTPLMVWDRSAHPPPGWRVAAVDVLLRAGGCYGLQVDGRTFSYTIRFLAFWND